MGSYDSKLDCARRSTSRLFYFLILLVFRQHKKTESSDKLWMFRIMATSSMCWLFLNQLLSWVLPAFEMQTWYASRSDDWFVPLAGYTAFRCRLVSFFLHKALHGTKEYPGFKPENILCQVIEKGLAEETTATASPGATEQQSASGAPAAPAPAAPARAAPARAAPAIARVAPEPAGYVEPDGVTLSVSDPNAGGSGACSPSARASGGAPVPANPFL